MDDTLSRRLRRLRELRGWSLTELAERSGVSYNHVYKLDRGSRRQAGAEILSALATALGTTTDYLTGASDDWRIPTDDERPIPGPEIAGMVNKLNQLPARLQAKISSLVELVLEMLGYGEVRKNDPQQQERLEQFEWLWAHLSPAEQAVIQARIQAEAEEAARQSGASRPESDPEPQTVNG